MIVAFHAPHNEGTVAGMITGPGFTDDSSLVDLYEVDASIRSFDNEEDARTWLFENEVTLELGHAVEGGYLYVTSDDDE